MALLQAGALDPEKASILVYFRLWYRRSARPVQFNSTAPNLILTGGAYAYRNQALGETRLCDVPFLNLSSRRSGFCPVSRSAHSRRHTHHIPRLIVAARIAQEHTRVFIVRFRLVQFL